MNVRNRVPVLYALPIIENKNRWGGNNQMYRYYYVRGPVRYTKQEAEKDRELFQNKLNQAEVISKVITDLKERIKDQEITIKNLNKEIQKKDRDLDIVLRDNRGKVITDLKERIKNQEIIIKKLQRDNEDQRQIIIKHNRQVENKDSTIYNLMTRLGETIVQLQKKDSILKEIQQVLNCKNNI